MPERKPFQAKLFFFFFSRYEVSTPKCPFSKGFLRVFRTPRWKICSKKLDLIGIFYHKRKNKTENGARKVQLWMIRNKNKLNINNVGSIFNAKKE